MPAPETFQQARPVLGHVNMMVDGLIASATIEDLRAIIRTTLATSPSSVSSTFTIAAREYLEKTYIKKQLTLNELFHIADHGLWEPTSQLYKVLKNARTIYGAGMGFASLSLLTEMVEATAGARWKESSDMDGALTELDGDITQAIQSAKEQIEGGRLGDIEAARATVDRLRSALQRSEEDISRW
ncbi:hypothetical protein CERSUDRAFT_119050, partial [Gelatoporia subvermispora B]